AGMEALRLLGPDNTLGDVCQVVKHMLYKQAKANGWRMMHYYKPNGQRSAYWGKREIRIAGVGQWSSQMTRLLVLFACVEPLSQIRLGGFSFCYISKYQLPEMEFE